jgi:hypothetical protein
MKKFSVDLSVTPITPQGFKIIKDTIGEIVELDFSKLDLFITEKQTSGLCINSSDLKKEMRGRPVAGANLADFFLANPKFVPRKFNHNYLIFYGTIFEDAHGQRCFKCIYRRAHEEWTETYVWCNSLLHPDDLVVGFVDGVFTAKAA